MPDSLTLDDIVDSDLGILDPALPFSPDNISIFSGNSDSAPRRRGRPPGSKNKPKDTSWIEDGEAGSNTANPRSPRAASSRSRTKIRAACAELVGIANLGLLFISKPDALNENEMTLVTDAVTAEAMTSERVMNWLLAASGVTPHILMIRALIAIAIPRLQRRGILPTPKIEITQAQYDSFTSEQKAAYDEYVRRNASASQAEAESASASNSTDTAVPMETRGASLFDGRYR